VPLPLLLVRRGNNPDRIRLVGLEYDI
jgi:hypothetical protein